MTMLVADFGGTHARAALSTFARGVVTLRAVFAEALAPGTSPADWLGRYYAQQGRPALDGCAACAAGPVERDGEHRRVRMTNRAEAVDDHELAQSCGLPRALLINDFEAVAQALPVLAAADLAAHGKNKFCDRPRLALGPGTGLGVAAWLPDGGGVAIASEAGHIRLAARDADEAALFARLADASGVLAAEDLLSGPGLLRLYRQLARDAGTKESGDDPAAVWAAHRDGDVLASAAVARFTWLLGACAGDLALAYGATGGVYLGGGIIPAWGADFDTSQFRAGFEAKGRFRDYLLPIASATIVHEYPALLGLTRLLATAVRG